VAYGIEVENENGDIIFGTKHLSMRKVVSGYQKPQYYSSTTDIYYNVHRIDLPPGLDRNSVLVFARPYIPDDPGNGTERVKGYWPMGVQFNNTGHNSKGEEQHDGRNTFTITAPDDSPRYYDSRDQADNTRENKNQRDVYKTYTRSSENWATLSGNQVYYEVWTSGTGIVLPLLDEVDTHGIQVVDSSGDLIFGSNTENFRVESSIYERLNPNLHTGQQALRRLSEVLMLPMKNTSDYSQSNYMALLNGTASLGGAAIGGFSQPFYNDDRKYEYPRSRIAYWKGFVEWHYVNEMGDNREIPACYMVSRLAYTRNEHYLEYYATYPRHQNDIGVKTLHLIGKSLQ